MKKTLVLVSMFLFFLQIANIAFSEVTMSVDYENRKAVVYDGDVEIAQQTFDEHGNFLSIDGKIPNGKVNVTFNEEYGFITYKNNMPNGEAKLYYPEGDIHFEGFYTNGMLRDEKKEFYRNGKLLRKENFRDGKRWGNLKEYYADGAKKSEAVYEGGKLIEQKHFDKIEKVGQK